MGGTDWPTLGGLHRVKLSGLDWPTKGGLDRAAIDNRVLEDIRAQLGDITTQRGPLMRESLSLQTLTLPDQSARLAWLAEHLPKLPGTGIVYTLTKRDAEQVANWLNEQGIVARAYFSDAICEGFSSSDEYRQYLEAQLFNNHIKALIATTALGMGYDKPDLGFVVHYQAPGSIVAYYQQVGRAGRAIPHAVGVLMSGDEDGEIQEFFRTTSFPDELEVEEVLKILGNCDGIKERELEQHINLRQGQLQKVLKFLAVENPAPVLRTPSGWTRTPVPYQLDHDHISRLTKQREVEWSEIQSYLHTDGCLMQFLAKALDDNTSRPCGRCANCLGRSVVVKDVSHEMTVKAARYLRQSEMLLEPKKQVAVGAFEVYGFRGNLPSNLRAETGRILSRWGDAAWGRMVTDGKHNNHFNDDLVTAVIDMIRQRWLPDPMPTWVTCVPSRKHLNLVPDFARRLAEGLELPFRQVIHKVNDNQPQKLQQNRYRQCRNLDGVFAVDPDVLAGPVFLVDDIVDSGWTLTVIAALLRRAGSGQVFPLALASTTTGD